MQINLSSLFAWL